VRTCLFTGLYRNSTFADCIDATARIGYDAVEVRSVSHLPIEATDAEVAAVGEVAARAGLEIAAIYTPYGRYTSLESDSARAEQVELARLYAARASRLGCRLIGHLPGGPSPEEATDSDYEMAAHWMAAAADAVAEFGGGIVMEMHHKALTETAESSLRLLRMTDRPNIGLTYDPGNMAIAQTPYEKDAIVELGTAIHHVHVKDIALSADPVEGWHPYEGLYWDHAALGAGSVDHAPLVRDLAGIGFSGHLSCETQVPGTPDDVAWHEHDVLSRMIRDAR
jgi:sugar phosphate isomerase/epimerase